MTRHRGLLPPRTPSSVAGLLILSVVPALAQEVGRPALGVGVGPSAYDLSGTGTSFVIAARIEYPPVNVLTLEVSVSYFEYTPQLSIRAERFLFPEVSVQGNLPLGPVWPYLGGGLGFAAVVSGRSDSHLTVHGAFGARLRLPGHWGVRGELRLRSVDPFVGNTADFTVGVARTL